MFLYLLLSFTFCCCAQKKEYIDVLGTWQMLNVQNNSQIDIGELVLEGDDLSETDSIKKIRGGVVAKRDPRLTKWYYVFNKEGFYEFRLGVGWYFKSRISKNNIYKYDKPFYEILSLKNDTLRIRENQSEKVLLLKRVNTDLGGVEIIISKDYFPSSSANER